MYLVGVGGTRLVHVDGLLLGEHVQIGELRLDKGHRLGIVLSAIVVREGGGDVDPLDLLHEEILLIQEEDDRRTVEVVAITNGAEEVHRLDHPVGGVVLVQHLVVFADGRDEDDGLDVVEVVDPFAPFGPLSTDIEHSANDLFCIVGTRGRH